MTQWGLDTLFNPAKRHMDDEKRRLQSTRSEVGDNSGGKRIDLDTGKVVIRRSGDDGDERADAEDAEDEAEISDAAAQTDAKQPDAKQRAKKPAKAKKATDQPSAAQLRAAKRRGRAPR